MDQRIRKPILLIMFTLSITFSMNLFEAENNDWQELSDENYVEVNNANLVKKMRSKLNKAPVNEESLQSSAGQFLLNIYSKVLQSSNKTHLITDNLPLTLDFELSSSDLDIVKKSDDIVAIPCSGVWENKTLCFRTGDVISDKHEYTMSELWVHLKKKNSTSKDLEEDSWARFDISKSLLNIAPNLKNQSLCVRPTHSSEIFDIHDEMEAGTRPFLVIAKKRVGVEKIRRKREISGSEKTGSKACQHHKMYMNFSEFFLKDRVISPKGVWINFCAGKCQHLMEGHIRYSTHALMQLIAHFYDPENAPEPCCAPTKMDSVMMLMVENDIPKLRNFKKMSAVRCGCV